MSASFKISESKISMRSKIVKQIVPQQINEIYRNKKENKLPIHTKIWIRFKIILNKRRHLITSLALVNSTEVSFLSLSKSSKYEESCLHVQ
jgi:hypothetical protein